MKISFAIFCYFIAFSFGWKPYKGLILDFKEDPYIENIKLVDMLGEGSFAEVWKGIEKSSRREVAVKLEKKTYYVKYLYQSFSVVLFLTNLLVAVKNEKKIPNHYNTCYKLFLSFHINDKITF